MVLFGGSRVLTFSVLDSAANSVGCGRPAPPWAKPGPRAQHGNNFKSGTSTRRAASKNQNLAFGAMVGNTQQLSQLPLPSESNLWCPPFLRQPKQCSAPRQGLGQALGFGPSRPMPTPPSRRNTSSSPSAAGSGCASPSRAHGVTKMREHEDAAGDSTPTVTIWQPAPEQAPSLAEVTS